MGLELERVGRLVERDPGSELVERQVQGLRGLADVLLDEQEPAGRALGREERKVVLAQHALAHEPEHQADLAGRDEPVGERDRGLSEAAARRDDLVEQVLLEAADERRRRCRRSRAPSRPGPRRRPVRRRPAARIRAPARVPARSAPWPRRRPVRRPGGRRRTAGPGAVRRRCTAIDSAFGQSTRPWRALRSARRPMTVAAAPRADPTRNPMLQRRWSRRASAARRPSSARPELRPPPPDPARPVTTRPREARPAGHR